MKRWMKTGLVLAALSATPATAFDGERPGFTMAVQAGVGQAEYTEQAAGGDGSFDGPSLATVWRMGWGLGESLSLHAVNRAQYFEGEGPDDRVQGLTGLGASWSFDRRAWPLYLTAEAGLAVHANRITTEDQDGFGFALGLGAEVRRHFTLEFSWLQGSVSGGGLPDRDLRNFALTFGWLGY